MSDIEIKRGYEVLPDNSVKFGIRIINNSDSAISDVEVILDYTESLFNLEGNKIQKLGNIPPTIARTANFVLKPLGCVHKENVGATVLYKDHTWEKHVESMRPKEVHCVCPFLKEMSITRSEFLELSTAGHSAEAGINFEGVTVDQLSSFLMQTCTNRLYKVDEYSIEGGRILYLASESIGEKAYYLLTAIIKENEGLTQVMLRAVSDKSHGLNGFMNEITADLRHIVNTVQSAHEIGIIKKEQVINIIDSVVQRSSFGGSGGEGSASVNIRDSVVQRTEITSDDKKQQENESLKKKLEETEREKLLPKENVGSEQTLIEKKKKSKNRNRIFLVAGIVFILAIIVLMNMNFSENNYPDEIHSNDIIEDEIPEPAELTDTTNLEITERDLGVVHYTQAPKTWTVDIPQNFNKVEVCVYAKGTDQTNQYGGWQAYLKINGEYVWEFLRHDSQIGGIIYDYQREEEVIESTARGSYLDVTEMVKPGENTITYYHYTSGDGIGVKLRISEYGTPANSESYII